LSVTPVEEFGNGTFFVTTTAATFLIMAVCFCVARVFRKSDTQASTIQALASGYGNIGYLGPPLAVAAFGPAAGVPVALIFCFENAMHFTLAPLMMAAGDNQRKNPLRLVAGIVTRIVFHPFILATLVGVAAAFTGFRPAAPVQHLVVLSGATGCAANRHQRLRVGSAVHGMGGKSLKRGCSVHAALDPDNNAGALPAN